LNQPSWPNIGPTPPIWTISHCTAGQRAPGSVGSRRPVLSARQSRIAPLWNRGGGFVPGPKRSRMAGIFWFGFSDRNPGVSWSPRPKSTRCALSGSPSASRAIETLGPLGVRSV
jgi:hypothetical protein